MNQAHLDEYFDFLRFPSVSTDSNHAGDVRACGQFLTDKLNSIGLTAQLHETPKHPVVMAKNEYKEGRPTVLIYGHYDVQPADPLELWVSDPFEPRVEGDQVFARGATDNKGQIFAHILGVAETIAEKGELPVNVVFVIEGEEEIGSPNLEAFLKAHRDELNVDVVAVSDTGMLAPGLGTFTYGLRGITCIELKISGPSMDLHSGVFGGSVANPATVVARIVASLHDENGHIAIPGFYDKVKDLEEWEREAWHKLPISDEDSLKISGSPALSGEKGFTDAERRWSRPTAEVNGIWGGYQGEGSKTIIPKEAHVKLSFRLVPDQEPEEIQRLVRKHIESIAPEGVRVEIEDGHSGSAYLTDPQAGYGKAAQRALEAAFGQKPALIREGGSIPIIQTFKDVLGADTIMLGLALPDCQIHAPNENFYMENFFGGIRMSRILLDEIAQA
jgi:acetylornithine deacetylase/succinyl-diaminopimelate desuccinylase-like protein